MVHTQLWKVFSGYWILYSVCTKLFRYLSIFMFSIKLRFDGNFFVDFNSFKFGPFNAKICRINFIEFDVWDLWIFPLIKN